MIAGVAVGASEAVEIAETVGVAGNAVKTAEEPGPGRVPKGS